MEVKQIVNKIFTSNTYLISKANSKWVWLIDIGDIEGIINSLDNDKIIKGVFITHAHFDHIYGINKLIDFFPDCIVFTSEYGHKGLLSDKLNFSYYHDDPLVFLGSNIQILRESEKIELFENLNLETIETPGHNWSCLTYKIDNYIFTGDSFIPNFKVVTKLKDGDVEASKESLKKIMSYVSNETIICPGHGEMTKIIQ